MYQHYDITFFQICIISTNNKMYIYYKFITFHFLKFMFHIIWQNYNYETFLKSLLV